MNEGNEPIRVAHVIGKMVGGGLESFIMNYYKNIDKNRIQFDFIIDSDSTIVPRKEIEEMGGKVIEIPPYQKTFSYIKLLRKVLKENNYKIIHSHINTLSVFPLYCAWRENIPIRIAHSHSTTNKKEWKKNLLKMILRPFSKVFATNYFACSEHAGRWLFGNRTFNNGNVLIINNAVNTEKFKYDEAVRKKVRKKFNLDNKLVIGHIGRFVEQKNHRFLIDIFNEIHKENSQSVLLLIGDGPLQDEIKEKVKKLDLLDSVYFLGIRNDVNELMQAMDCFAFPSLYEGLGIVLIEAQCSGLNCVCSEEVPKETALTDKISFLELDNLISWKKKILDLNLERKNNYIELIKKAGYEINIESDKLVNIYIELMKGIKI